MKPLTKIWMLGLFVLFVILRITADPTLLYPNCVEPFGSRAAVVCPKDPK